MTPQDLEKLKELFNKKKELEDSLGKYNYPVHADFRMKNVKIEVSFYTKDYSSERKTIEFYSIPINHEELKYFFNKEKNRLMLKLHDLNHQIEKVKIEL